MTRAFRLPCGEDGRGPREAGSAARAASYPPFRQGARGPASNRSPPGAVRKAKRSRQAVGRHFGLYGSGGGAPPPSALARLREGNGGSARLRPAAAARSPHPLPAVSEGRRAASSRRTHRDGRRKGSGARCCGGEVAAKVRPPPPAWTPLSSDYKMEAGGWCGSGRPQGPQRRAVRPVFRGTVGAAVGRGHAGGLAQFQRRSATQCGAPGGR